MFIILCDCCVSVLFKTLATCCLILWVAVLTFAVTSAGSWCRGTQHPSRDWSKKVTHNSASFGYLWMYLRTTVHTLDDDDRQKNRSPPTIMSPLVFLTRLTFISVMSKRGWSAGITAFHHYITHETMLYFCFCCLLKSCDIVLFCFYSRHDWTSRQIFLFNTSRPSSHLLYISYKISCRTNELLSLEVCLFSNHS